MDFLRKLLILAVVGAVGAGTVALVEHLMFEAPRPAVSDVPPPLPVIKKKPVRQWKWRLT
ncbi:hypothetical protein EN836_08250 [Mesorhizobium sp. M1C.F.Ca.ET.193.01.1.1]|uniref:hypothetical protein n=1 Tax=unclassified Mesorhizobium TaxID=325217 RepID=UPI000FD5560D|nr:MULTISPECIES: hypothetical protein [unclassified Mesorhizobium]TGT02363.1 hypothetical protein EN820_24850 [bacterium M00.F.Ca.ET.177.01.1.1]RWA76275.1 MAG: hypothetical protein EOQ28_05375 [Mesorhizobium sp.]RWC03969.1 MAG: hypothetical protein EOQ57_06165 [Mesorhizobium sp.]RWG87230.1 MAG: hypothetical protein EOQ69_03265 [Mesorhizobium sp.]RWK07633.1 MAG: hypothetical protein EOR39_21730 [Mesorhizobium sp.]